MDREFSDGGNELEKAASKFIDLKNRFIREVKDDEAHVVIAEGILGEVERVAVEALVKTGGKENIMAALDRDFVRPVLEAQINNPYYPGVILIVMGRIATNVAKRLSR